MSAGEMEIWRNGFREERGMLRRKEDNERRRGKEWAQ